MRIISGTLKGKRITAPTNLPVRPTTDFAKEALFNILNNEWYFDEITVLDLFSGIGSISLEFASRGAKKVTSVDNFYGCVKFLDETAKQLKLDDVISTVKSDVIKYLDKQPIKKFDIIFADPPYHNEQFSTVKSLFELLKPGGLMVLSHTGRGEVPTLHRIVVVDSRSYGTAHLTFFRREDA